MNKNNFFWRILSLGVVAIVMMLGCKKDNPEEPTPIPEEPQVKVVKNLVVADDVVNTKIEDVTENTIVFSTTNLPQNVEKGGYIASGITDEAPSGYLRKIIEKREENGKVYLTTENAALEEVVEEGTFSFSKEYSASDIFTQSNDSMPKVSPLKTSSGFSFESKDETILFDQDGNEETKDDQIVFSWENETNFTLDFTMEFSKFKLKKFEYIPKYDFTSGLMLKAKVGKKFSLQDLKKIKYFEDKVTENGFEKRFPLKPITGFVGPVPVVIEHYLSLFINIEGEVKAQISAGIKIKKSASAGFGYYQGEGWKAIAQGEDDITPMLDFKGTFSTRAELGLKYALSPYGLATVSAKLTPYATMEARTQNIDMGEVREGKTPEMVVEGKWGIELVGEASLEGPIIKKLIGDSTPKLSKKIEFLEPRVFYTKTFDLCKDLWLCNFKLSESEVLMVGGATLPIGIAEGTGYYQIESSDPTIVEGSYEVKEENNQKIENLILTAKNGGTAVVSVQDMGTNLMKKVRVNVILPAKTVHLAPNTTTIVNVTPSTEGYQIINLHKHIVEATEVKAGQLYLQAKTMGTALVSLRDTKSGKMVENIRVVVSPLASTLTLSEFSVTAGVGETSQVRIVSGSGKYQVESANTTIATATEVKAGVIAITGKGQGQTSVLVTDTQTGQTKTIAVTVTPKKPTHPDLAVSKSSVTLEKDNTETLTITSSGNFTAVMGNTSVASVQKLGTNQVKITALKQGETTLTITDTQTTQVKTVAVKVTEKFTSPSTEVPEGVIIENGVLKKWPCNKIPEGGKVVIPNSVTSIGNSAFFDCSSLTSVVIPNSVIHIGSYAFYGCSSLTSVTIPNSVTSIGQYAFSDCSSLTSVMQNATVPPSLDDYSGRIFPSNLQNIYVPAESVSAYKTHKDWQRYATLIKPKP